MYTVEEVERCGRDMLTAGDIHRIVRMDAHAIRLMAREGKLPWPCLCRGTRVLFPRDAFVRYMRGLA